ncbi:hypothetical protein [Streptomyces sp. HF10]|uniref:hypothetical protein n=1 Tax=Streptomyces sp. HF10 TaxID=2692233 RepID=UPI001317A692|nr:hypothetical protein [Streptomyces sp. HF10]QHC28523.1 hypothetical protein GR129_06490 [Streptomyces sp. HF10]
MTFQIRAISIYNRDGEIRTVPFQTGSLNIITGDSRRGKSAILTIVDYCLGSDDFVIRGAALRNFVHVFALTISRETSSFSWLAPHPSVRRQPTPLSVSSPRLMEHPHLITRA